MSTPRDLLLQATEEEEAFLAVLRKHHARDDPFDLAEVLPSMDKKQLDSLWENLQNKFTMILLAFDFNDVDGEQKEEFTRWCSLVQGVVTVAVETITQDDPHIPRSLIDTVIVLHGILLSLPECVDKLRNSISRLCELWWKEDLLCKQELGPQTLTYLLQRSDLSTATGGDIKRVHHMQEVLKYLDLKNDSSADIRSLLQRAVVSMLFLKNDDGRKFLAYLLNLTPAFTETLHRTIKNHLAWCPKPVMPLYGEIYFLAWRNSIGANRENIEKVCIQDLMYHSILAQPKLASSLRKILGYIHRQKTQRGVDEMLLSLYDPILWRNLSVANGQVRLHAVSVLIDAFPLQSPESRVEEKDAVMQKQFDTLREMLYDPNPAVRNAVVLGVCFICNKYWELIPPHTIKDLIQCLVSDLAYDGASADVRAAVFKGLAELVDNPLSHPMMKSLLPEMSNCFHDTSEKVRVAFVDMLLKVKVVKAIKFWNVVSLEHLLARLELDPPPVARRLSKLLLNSYLPPDKEVDVLLTRCLALIESNPGAARRFYQYALPHMSTGNTVRLIVTVFNLLVDGVKKLSQDSEGGAAAGESEAEPDFLESFGEEENTRPRQAGGATRASDEGPTQDEEPHLVDNLDSVAGMLEVAVILWTGVGPKINTEANKELRQKLEFKASQVLPSLLRSFQDSRILSALLMLSGFIPPNLVPTVSRGMVSRLKRMTADSPPDDYYPILEVMCRWDKVPDLLELISDWLEAGLHDNQPEAPDPKNRRSRKSVSFAEPVLPKPDLALRYLHHLLQHQPCREILLSSGRPALTELTQTLNNVTKSIEKRLQASEPLGDLATDDFLIETFEVYLKLEILLHDQTAREHNAITVIEQTLAWADYTLISLLRKRKTVKKHRRLLGQTEMTLLQDPSQEGATLGGQTLATQMMTMSDTLSAQTASDTMLSDTLLAQKRTAGDDNESQQKQLAIDILQHLLTVATNMLLVGVGDHELASHLADFAMNLLTIDETSSPQFLPLVSKLMYQITELTLTLGSSEDEGVGSQSDLVPGMLGKVLAMIVKLTTHKREQAERILPTVKPALGEILSVYYRHHSLNNTLQTDMMSTIADAMLTNMADTVKKDNDYECRQTIHELPLLTSFFLSLIWRKTSLVGLLLSEISRSINSGRTADIESLAGVCHMISTLSHVKKSLSGLKDCVMALEQQVGQQGAALEQELDDSPARQMQKNIKTMLGDCKTRIGMI